MYNKEREVMVIEIKSVTKLDLRQLTVNSVTQINSQFKSYYLSYWK